MILAITRVNDLFKKINSSFSLNNKKKDRDSSIRFIRKSSQTIFLYRASYLRYYNLPQIIVKELNQFYSIQDRAQFINVYKERVYAITQYVGKLHRRTLKVKLYTGIFKEGTLHADTR